MADVYHGIMIGISQQDPAIFQDLCVIGKKEVSEGGWVLLKVEVEAADLDRHLPRIQGNLVQPFYCHFYRGNELIVVFHEKVFRVTPDPSTWNEVVLYGRSLGIPAEQLDFYPCRVEDESY